MSIVATGRRRALAAPAGGTVPFVSDIEIITNVSSGSGIAAIRFHDDRTGAGSDDGRIITRLNGLSTYTDMGNDNASVPVDHTGEWTSDIIVESEWEVAYTNIVSGSFFSQFAAINVYTGLDTVDMQWRQSRPGGKAYTPGTSTVVADFRIREVADTGNFTDFQVTLTTIQT